MEKYRAGVKISIMPSKRKKYSSFYIESLGCAKNSVDSRSIAELLINAGKKEVDSPERADLIIVNTCGFIRPAKEESVEVLREFAANKKEGQALIAAGCLSEREKYGLMDQIDGLDAAYGTRRWEDILEVLAGMRSSRSRPYAYFPETPRTSEVTKDIHRSAKFGASAYLKIAEGCDRRCAFCTIPEIKGPMVSRSMESILKDAVHLQNQQVKEIVLIAQDTTSYGRDFGMEDGLSLLLEEMVRSVPDIPWIRIMYMYPGSISEKLISIMAGNEQILPYLDIPLQHADPGVLHRMLRPSNIDAFFDFIVKMRKKIPGLALRTTFIVGYPGESEKEFQVLENFIRVVKFDHIGFFPYFHERNTSAYQYEDNIPENVKNERIHILAKLQEEISLEKNKRLIGKRLEVLIEGNGDGISIGRSYRDAPEIDGLVMLNEVVGPGEIFETQVTGALIHDLIAKKI